MQVSIVTAALSLGTGLGSPSAGRASMIIGDSAITVLSFIFFTISAAFTAWLGLAQFSWIWLIPAFFAGASDGYQMCAAQKFASVHDKTPKKAFEKFRIMRGVMALIFAVFCTFTIMFIPEYIYPIVVVGFDFAATFLAIRSNSLYLHINSLQARMSIRPRYESLVAE
jgi:MFS family permease